jgi:hypothetical protein
MPGCHYIELFVAAFEPAPRKAPHLTSGPIVKYTIQGFDRLGHVYQFSGLRFADNQGHVGALL